MEIGNANRLYSIFDTALNLRHVAPHYYMVIPADPIWTFGQLDLNIQLTYRTLVILGILVSVLTGCARGGDYSVPGTTKSGKSSQQQPVQEPVVTDTPPPPNRKLPVPSSKPNREKPKPDRFSIDPQTLIKLDEAAILDKLGQPTQILEEPPAVVWRYEKGDCKLDIFFYESVNTKQLRSLNYKLESTEPRGNAEKHCIRN